MQKRTGEKGVVQICEGGGRDKRDWRMGVASGCELQPKGSCQPQQALLSAVHQRQLRINLRAAACPT
jgi:hypothetical protein